MLNRSKKEEAETNAPSEVSYVCNFAQQPKKQKTPMNAVVGISLMNANYHNTDAELEPLLTTIQKTQQENCFGKVLYVLGSALYGYNFAWKPNYSQQVPVPADVTPATPNALFSAPCPLPYTQYYDFMRQAFSQRLGKQFRDYGRALGKAWQNKHANVLHKLNIAVTEWDTLLEEEIKIVDKASSVIAIKNPCEDSIRNSFELYYFNDSPVGNDYRRAIDETVGLVVNRFDKNGDFLIEIASCAIETPEEKDATTIRFNNDTYVRDSYKERIKIEDKEQKVERFKNKDGVALLKINGKFLQTDENLKERARIWSRLFVLEEYGVFSHLAGNQKHNYRSFVYPGVEPAGFTAMNDYLIPRANQFTFHEMVLKPENQAKKNLKKSPAADIAAKSSTEAARATRAIQKRLNQFTPPALNNQNPLPPCETKKADYPEQAVVIHATKKYQKMAQQRGARFFIDTTPPPSSSSPLMTPVSPGDSDDSPLLMPPQEPSSLLSYSMSVPISLNRSGSGGR